MQNLFSEIVDEVRPLLGQGKVPDFIPALAHVPANQLGIAVCSAEGELCYAGTVKTPFSIQSMFKVFSLVQAIQHCGKSLSECQGTNRLGSRSTRRYSWRSSITSGHAPGVRYGLSQLCSVRPDACNVVPNQTLREIVL